MEYELFRSKLKPSIDGASVSGIIRCSSSGLSSHRTAAMELVLEGSVRERRERMPKKAKNSLRLDPTLQAKRTSEAPNMSIPEVQLPAPAPSQSLPNDATGIVTSPASASAEHNGPPDSPALSKRAKRIKVVRSEKPLTDVKTNPSSSENFVEMACQNCGVRQLRSCLWSGLYCNPCPLRLERTTKMKCVGCDTIRVDDVGACTGCHRTFK